MSTGFSRKSAAMMILGSSILAMGMCNIHAHSGVTEGGVLGLTLLLEHLFAISPALSALILNVLCYALGWRTLGRGFLLNSAVACLCYSAVYALLEPFAPMFPLLISSQLVASLVGSLFVGFGAGICRPLWRRARRRRCALDVLEPHHASADSVGLPAL